MFALHQRAVGHFDKLFHYMLAAGHVTGILGHVVQGYRPAGPATGIGIVTSPTLLLSSALPAVLYRPSGTPP